MTAETIAHALKGRRCGRGWIARCPVHDDRSPSLSIGEGDSGKVLLRCWAGCDSLTVIRELQARGLWPERERREWTPAERAAYARANREAPALARHAGWWRRTRLAELDEAKLAAVNSGIDVDRLAAAARAHYHLQSAGADGVVAAYLQARAADPHHTRELVRQGEAWERACKTVVLAVLTGNWREVGCAA